jgi:hypothetical protein
MRSFIRRNLDPADRLGEVLFGLIMALGFTAAVSLGREEADNRALFIGILGCNIAWGIVDGVMYALTAHFERGRLARLKRDALAAPTEAEALQRVRDELDDRLGSLTTDEERAQIAGWTLRSLRQHDHQAPGMHREDVLGGAAIGLLIVLATLPVVVPFLLVADPHLAVRLSNLVALTELFLLGLWWGRVVGHSSIRIATGLTLIGVVLVLIAVVLGG